MQECEVKFLKINPQHLQQQLVQLGAEYLGEFHQRWIAFDYPDWRLDKRGAWIRLRDGGNGKVTLSYKQRLGVKSHNGKVNDDGMEEIEVEVSQYDTTADLLKQIGFVVKHEAEKKRISWKKQNILFDIDYMPGLDPYLEIEAPSWSEVDQAITWLGLDPDQKKICSANQVYALSGVDVSQLQKLSFTEGLVPKQPSSTT